MSSLACGGSRAVRFARFAGGDDLGGESYLADNIPANRFVTLFYAELDPESGALSFLNAGHNPPLIVHSAGTVEQLASGGLPLGIKRDAEYREGRTQLQLGDVLVIYSDGVTEAVSPTGEEFGATRLYEVVSRNIEASAAGIRDRIESSLTKFCAGHECRRRHHPGDRQASG